MAAKFWRYAAAVLAPLAGLFVVLTACAWVTVLWNAQAYERAEDREFWLYTAAADRAAETQTAQRAFGGRSADRRPVAWVDWSTVVAKVAPSVVTVSREVPEPGAGTYARAWSLPGMHQNAVTKAFDALFTYYAKRRQEGRYPKEWHNAGAGFIAGSGRYVVTAAHVVDKPGRLRVKLASGEWRAATVAHFDETKDIAILRMEGPAGPPIAVAPWLPRQGQEIMAFGAPTGDDFTVSTGIVSGHVVDGSFMSEASFIQIGAIIDFGNSGGVVVNSFGEAFGIVSYGRAFTVTIPVDRALAILSSIEQREQRRTLGQLL